ncbi:hypothetical protein ACLI4Z_18050 [Natrialbaceae archaeon A-arb3/5]
MTRKVVESPERSDSKTARLLEFLRRNVLWIIVVLLVIIAIALLLGVGPTVGRNSLLALACAGWGIVAGYPISGFVKSKLGDEPGVFLVDVKAEDIDHDAALYWSPYTEFQEFNVTDGSLDQVAPFLYFGRNVDPDELTVEGVWRGSLTDRELLAALSAVKECRGMLEEDARRGFALETNLWSVVYRAAKDATKAVVKTFEEGTLPDEGEGVDNAVSDAMAQFDLERMADRIDDDENADLDELVEATGDDLDDEPEQPETDPLAEPQPADD